MVPMPSTTVVRMAGASAWPALKPSPRSPWYWPWAWSGARPKPRAKPAEDSHISPRLWTKIAATTRPHGRPHGSVRGQGHHRTAEKEEQSCRAERLAAIARGFDAGSDSGLQEDADSGIDRGYRGHGPARCVRVLRDPNRQKQRHDRVLQPHRTIEGCEGHERTVGERDPAALLQRRRQCPVVGEQEQEQGTQRKAGRVAENQYEIGSPRIRCHRKSSTHGPQNDAQIDVSSEPCPEQRRAVGTDPDHEGSPGRAAAWLRQAGQWWR